MAKVLITGCSSGFGLLTALEFAGRGHEVFATCRSGESAARMAGIHAAVPGLHWRQLDVTDEQATLSTVADIVADAEGLDALVNNAGIAHPGAVEDLDSAVLRRVMNTNFFGALWTTRAVLPGMRQRGSGCIVMMSSLSALVGLPGEAIYAASKAALEAAAEALRYEVERFGIRVFAVEPGAFSTAMPRKIAATGRGPQGSPYAPLIGFLTELAASRLGAQDDPKYVARLIADIVESPPARFRIPAGAQAEDVTSRLAALDDESRPHFIRGVHGTEWWSRGETCPGNEA
jgi:NAD(P)-dependent dehydrogenase (short-subunit alcohol dehydrogenase family)